MRIGTRFVGILLIWMGGYSTILAQGAACGCNDCPIIMPDGFTESFELQIQNATNPIVGQNGQALCGVSLHFSHEYVSDLLIKLTAPNGTEITLVGPVNFFNPTNGSTWDISFIPCSEQADPDNNFAAQWNSEQPWGAFGNFNGTYYPYFGCLEDFSGSPVNGTWILDIVDGLPNDEGALLGYQLIFCDPDGIECFNCNANAGNLLEADVVACKGSDSLLLEPGPAYANPLDSPPAPQYAYTYIIGGQGGTLVGYDSIPDLRGYTEGNYIVCGLSYLQTAQPLLPVPDDSITVQEISSELNSGTPPFCGSITPNCIDVTILPPPPDSFVYARICPGECFDFFGTTYCQDGIYRDTIQQGKCSLKATLELEVVEPDTVFLSEAICAGSCSSVPGFQAVCAAGIYTQTFVSADGCDSVVVLQASLIAPEAQLQPPAYWPCGQDSLILVAANNLPGSTLDWQALGGAQFAGQASSDTVFATRPGEFLLKQCLSSQNTVCCDTLLFEVTQDTQFLNTPAWAVSDSLLCENGTLLLSIQTVPNATGYIWDWPAGLQPMNQPNDTLIEVQWFAGNGGEVCVRAVNACDTSATLCQTIKIGFPPEAVGIIGPSSACLGTQTWFSVDASVQDSLELLWSVTGGTFVSTPGSDSILVEWNTTDSLGTVAVVVRSACGESNASQHNILLNRVPDAGSILADSFFCSASPAEFIYAPPDGANSWVWVPPGNANPLGNLNTDTLLLDWLQPGVSSVCVTPQNGCGAGPQACVTAQVEPQPVANAGIDQTVCPGTLMLEAQSSVGGSTGLWTTIQSPIGSNIPSSAQDSLVATLSLPGDYVFEWTETLGGCADRDTMAVQVLDKPQIDNLSFDCTPDNLTYSISFEVSGGLPPYLVNAIPLLPNVTFASLPVLNALPYSFEIEDAAGCRDTLGGNYNCPCFSDAGTMGADTIFVCEGDTIQAGLPLGINLDGNDIGVYFLHDSPGNVLGNILAQSTDGRFVKLPGMSLGQVYFVSFVVGNISNNQVNLNDPCLDVSNGQPVVFNGFPTADAGTGDLVCGLETMVSATPAPGGRWLTTAGITFDDDEAAQTTVTAFQHGDFPVIWSAESNGCMSYDTIVIRFRERPVIDSVSVNCLTDTSVFQLNAWAIGGTPPYSGNGINGIVDGNRFIADPSPNYSTFNFYFADNNGCQSDTLAVQGFACSCITDAGLMPQDTVHLCSGDTLRLTTSSGAVLAPGDTLLYMLHDQVGPGLGNILSQQNIPEFVFGPFMDLERTYYVSSVAAQADNFNDDLCRSVSPGTPVVWHQIPQVELAGDTSACEGDTLVWSIRGEGNPPFSATLRNDAGKERTLLFPDDTYFPFEIIALQTGVWRVTSLEDNWCVNNHTNMENSLTVHPRPTADAGTDTEISCLDSTVVLDGSGSNGMGAALEYTWYAFGVPLTVSPIYQAEQPGAYSLVVTTPVGCSDRDTVVVEDKRDIPVIDSIQVRNVRCFGESNGALKIISISGGNEPVLIGFEQSPFSENAYFDNLTAGVYQIIVEDINGCQSTQSVTISQPGEKNISLGPDLEAAFGDELHLTIESDPPVVWWDSVSWHTPLLGIIGSDDSLKWIASRTTLFVVSASDAKGCLAIDSLIVRVEKKERVYTPNVFSPGQSGNDMWSVFAGPEVERVELLRIYDRWGNLVFQREDFVPNDPALGWDGRHNGSYVDDAVFAYTLRLRMIDGTLETQTGDITVIRGKE